MADTQNGVISELTYCDVGTDISELFETVSEHWATDQSSASVTLRCKWSEHMIVISNLLTRLAVEGAPSAEYPIDNQIGEEKLKLLDVDVSPFPTQYSEAGQAIEYQYAKITLHYGTLIPDISYQSTSEYWTINTAGIRYKLNDGTYNMTVPPEEAPGVLVFGHTLTIGVKRINLADFDLSTWEGKVNSTEVNGTQFGGGGLLRTYPEGTLLCCAPSLHRHAVAGYYDATFTFNYRSIPWNKFYMPQNGKTFENSLVTMCDASGNDLEIYPSVDLNPLFQKIGILTDSEEEVE